MVNRAALAKRFAGPFLRVRGRRKAGFSVTFCGDLLTSSRVYIAKFAVQRYIYPLDPGTLSEPMIFYFFMAMHCLDMG